MYNHSCDLMDNGVQGVQLGETEAKTWINVTHATPAQLFEYVNSFTQSHIAARLLHLVQLLCIDKMGLKLPLLPTHSQDAKECESDYKYELFIG